MAATGYTPIYLYYSGTATHIPLAANLGNGELAINAADGNLFYKNTSNAVVTIPVLQSSSTQSGWLSSTDWSTFNSKQPAGTYVTSVTGTAPVVSSGGTTPAISMAAASASANGYLTSTDWTTFNGKAPSFTYTSGYVPYGQGTTTPTQSSNLYFDDTNLSVGTTSNLLSAANRNTLTINGTSTSAIAFGSGNALKSYIYNNGTDLTVSGNAGAIKFNTGTDSTKFTIQTTGDCTLASGNLVIGTSGKGIDFSATAGTGTSELLADYEEGTWTPTVTAASGSITSYTSSGYYTKVGRQVTVCFTVTITNNGTGAGWLNVSLPYTNGSQASAGVGRENAATGIILQSFVAASSATAYVFNSTNGYPGGTNYSPVCTMTYFV